MKKIIHIPENMGNNPMEIHNGDVENGFNSDIFVLNKHKFKYSNEKNIFSSKNIFKNELNRLLFFFEVFKTYDVIHYNFGKTIFSPVYSNPLRKKLWLFSYVFRTIFNLYQQIMRLIELVSFKLAGKYITVTYQGDDGRQKKYQLKNFKFNIARQVNEDYYPPFSDLEKKYKCFLYSIFAENIYSINPDIIWVLPNKTKFLPYAHKVNKSLFIDRDFSKITFLHCPSNDRVKGSKFIIESLQELKKKYDFDVKVIKDVTHEMALKEINECSILIDQLYCGWYGGIAVEALRTGMPCLSYIREDDLVHIPSEMRNDIPVVNINENNLSSVLSDILKKKYDLEKISLQSFNYAQKWHDRKLISKIINKCVE